MRFQLACMIATLGIPASALAAEPATYNISMEIHDDGRLVASPMLQVRAGETAAVTRDDGLGHVYFVALTPSPAEGDTVLVTSEVRIQSEGNSYAANPRLTVRLEQSSAIELGQSSPVKQPVRVDFTIGRVAGQ